MGQTPSATEPESTSPSASSGERCGRCGEPMHEATARLLIELGPLQATQPTLSLCSHCSSSLTHWFERRRHGSDRPGSAGIGATRRSRSGARRSGASTSADVMVPGGILSPRVVVLAILFGSGLLIMWLLLNSLLG